MYAVFGWINVALVALMLLPYVMRKLNEFFFKKKKGAYIKTMRLFRKSHRYLGALLIVSIFVHGWLALGTLMLHTGTILGALALIMAVFGLIFIFAKKRWAYKTHKALAVAFVALLLLHLIVPSALYYIF
jgi:hypothetical protein